MINVYGSSFLTVVGTIDPQTLTTQLFTDVVDMGKFDQAVGILMTGDMVVGATVEFGVYTCDAGGGNAVLLKAITSLAVHATANDNVQAIIAVKASELATSTKRHCKFGATHGSTGGPAAVLALGIAPRTGLASANDLATVVQIKTI